ncbi:MAG: hypothetical protein K2X72_32715 [Reyranella sp.]|nr:hypothetical protein [Reyranella sp.]
MVLEVIATVVVETVTWLAKMLFWPARRSEAPVAAALRKLPELGAPHRCRTESWRGRRRLPAGRLARLSLQRPRPAAIGSG